MSDLVWAKEVGENAELRDDFAEEVIKNLLADVESLVALNKEYHRVVVLYQDKYGAIK